MPPPSAIALLPEADKAWLDKELIRRGFSGYVEIAELLLERGYQIGKSSIHRYGQQLERKLASVQASTQAALLIADAAPDDADVRSQAVLSMVQTEMFNALVSFQDAEDNNLDPIKRLELMAKCGKGIAEIVKASVNQKQWQAEVREKTEKAVKAVEKIAKKGGLSADAVTEMRKHILGISE